MSVRGFTAALNSRGRFRYKEPEGVVDYLVIGGGVVGLSIAQRLASRFPDASTYVIERHGSAGQETSSRNSEVIHAGIYYPPNSLKMRMCLRGKHLLYERCQTRSIPYKRVGKLIVGRAEHKGYLERLLSQCQAIDWPNPSPFSSSFNSSEPAVPVQLLTGDEARGLEPGISPDIAHALWSPSTGIIDSHSLLTSLEQDVQESRNGQLVYATEVVRVDPFPNGLPSSNESSQRPREEGWVVQVSTAGSEDALLARTLINASGLSSTLILNSLLSEPIPMFYARGSYASYGGKSLKASRLIYPVPAFNQGNSHSFHSLGTHLTIDLGGKIRFGPDLEFLDPPKENKAEQVSEKDYTDFWQKSLRPDETRLSEMHQAVSQYLMGVEAKDLSPDYVGIRPKLVGPGAGFSDFTTRVIRSGENGAPMINLLGIESPGVTSCLALGEYVVDEIVAPMRGL